MDSSREAKLNPTLIQPDSYRIPPNFDPDKAHGKKAGSRKFVSSTGEHISRPRYIKNRNMAPTHIKCTRCGHLLRKGTKQYSKIQKSQTEEYKGIPIVYLSFKCRDCGADMSLKSNPETNFYLPHSGCTLPWIKDEEERWKVEDGGADTGEEKLDHIQRLNRQVQRSIKAAEDDAYLQDRLARAKRFKEIGSHDEVAQTLAMKKQADLDAILGIKEEEMVRANFRSREERPKKVNKFSSFVKGSIVGKKDKEETVGRKKFSSFAKGSIVSKKVKAETVRRKKKKTKKKKTRLLALPLADLL